jgi:hypothetical protein
MIIQYVGPIGVAVHRQESPPSLLDQVHVDVRKPDEIDDKRLSESPLPSQRGCLSFLSKYKYRNEWNGSFITFLMMEFDCHTDYVILDAVAGRMRCRS